MISIFIADDHPSIILGLKSMLAGREDMAVTGTFGSGAELLQGLDAALPHILMLDIHLPDTTGNSLARIISTKYPQVKMIAFTNMNTDFHVQDMLQHGCMGYLLKTAEAGTVVEAIHTVYEGRQFLEQPMDAALRDNMRQAGKQLARQLPVLTRREKEVLQLICNGSTNQQIADALFLSLRTVENHRFNLQQKLQTKTTAELVKFALHAGLAG